MFCTIVEDFQASPSFIQVVIIIAAAATIFMLIQLIMMLIGIGTDSTFDGGDVDLDTDVANDTSFFELFGLRLLTLRNVIAFFAIGGWTLVAIYQGTKSYGWAIPFGILAGVITMVLISLFTRQMEKMQTDGTLDIKNAVGKIGTVYLTIPAKKNGYGKVNVVVQDRLVELSAMTDGDSIPTGAEVVVVDATDEYILVIKN